MARRWALLVSSDAAVLSAAEAALNDAGLHITTSPSVAHGAAQARDLRPALIISDADFGASRPAGIPFILLSLPLDAEQFRAQVLALTKEPLPGPAPVEVPAPVEAPAPAVAPPPPPPKRWLLVAGVDGEDMPVVEMAVLGTGLEAASAGDASATVIQAGALKPELILCDLDALGPELAPELLRAFRGNPGMGAVPVVFTGALDEEKAMLQVAPDDRAARFMRKPLDLEKLRSLFARMLSGEAPDRAEAASPGTPELGTVLVLDGDPAVQGVLDGSLGEMGYKTVVSDAALAMSQAYDLKPVLIISDLQSAGAVDVLTAMRMDALLLSVPFLFVGDLPADKAMGMLPWGDPTVRFTKKPLDMTKLKALVTELAAQPPS